MANIQVGGKLEKMCFFGKDDILRISRSGRKPEASTSLRYKSLLGKMLLQGVGVNQKMFIHKPQI